MPEKKIRGIRGREMRKTQHGLVHGRLLLYAAAAAASTPTKCHRIETRGLREQDEENTGEGYKKKTPGHEGTGWGIHKGGRGRHIKNPRGGEGTVWGMYGGGRGRNERYKIESQARSGRCGVCMSYDTV